MAATPPNINEFFRGRSVLITGGLGFLGKVLVEKLLWSCPDIGPIYLLLRGKKGQDPEERLRKSLDLPLFNRIKQGNPSVLEKLVAIPGDLTYLELGISQHHRSILEENVSVIFHVAAPVRFNDVIKKAVLMNVRGTREILEIATNMKKLKALVYTSTAYSNTNRLVVGEEVYPMKEDWRKIIKAVETIDEALLDPITEKLIGMRPNTYTYTKGLAEQVVLEYRERLPVLIYRPTIVLGTNREPLIGWIDSFNGPTAMFALVGKGIMRVLYYDPNTTSDFIPVDIVITGMVTAAWVEGTTPRRPDMPVYNASASHTKTFSGIEIQELSLKSIPEAVSPGTLWLPYYRPTASYVDYFIRFFLTQLLPALFIDFGLRVAGRKPMLTKTQRQIFMANMTISYFAFHTWDFKTANFVALYDLLLPEDRKAWRHRVEDVDHLQFMEQGVFGSRKYLLKEDDVSMGDAKKHYNRLKLVDRIGRGLLYILVSWCLLRINTCQLALRRITDLLCDLPVLMDLN